MKKDLVFAQLKSALYDIEEMYDTRDIESVDLSTSKTDDGEIFVTLDVIFTEREEEEEEEPPTQIDYSEVNKGIRGLSKGIPVKDVDEILILSGYTSQLKSKGDKKGD